MPTRDLDYRCDDVNLRGYLAWSDGAKGPQPGVLVFHEGLGLGEFAMARARRLAGLGYVALAADMFGDRRQATNLQEVATRGGGLRAEREKLRARGRAALSTLAALPQVDAGRLAAIGFCFGGSVVLELAREGADLKAVVSFHGVLATKMPAVSGQGEARGAAWAPPAPTIPWRRPIRSRISRTRCARPPCATGRSSATATRCMVSPTP